MIQKLKKHLKMLKNKDLLDYFDDKEKAIDHAIWLNFKYRVANIRFGVITETTSKFAVCEEATAKEMKQKFLDILPKDYSDISYRKIDFWAMDSQPLPHLQMLRGLLYVFDDELLRFIIHAKVPINKLIRHELSGRGFDENHRWCGYDRSREIWLK